MTVLSYISEKLKAFGATEAQLSDFSISTGLDLQSEYSSENARAVGVGLASAIEELALAPRISSVSEAGFSMSWDYGKLGQYYAWLCRKWGVKPSQEALGLMGVSSIMDRTSKW